MAQLQRRVEHARDLPLRCMNWQYHDSPFFLREAILVAPFVEGQRHCDASAMGAEELQKFFLIFSVNPLEDYGCESWGTRIRT